MPFVERVVGLVVGHVCSRNEGIRRLKECLYLWQYYCYLFCYLFCYLLVAVNVIIHCIYVVIPIQYHVHGDFYLR